MYKKLLIIFFLLISCKATFISDLRETQKMPTGTEWENTTSTVACTEGTPYPHETLSCKSYGTSLKCCDWHKENIDEELDIICWETWCLSDSDGCWKYKEYTCNNYTPLK